MKGKTVIEETVESTMWATWSEVLVGGEWSDWGDGAVVDGPPAALTVADGLDAWRDYMRGEFLAEEAMLAECEDRDPHAVTYRVVVAAAPAGSTAPWTESIVDWVEVSAHRDGAGVLRVDVLTASGDDVETWDGRVAARASDVPVMLERLTAHWRERLEGAPSHELKLLVSSLSTGVSAFLSTPDDEARIAAARAILQSRRIAARKAGGAR